MNKKITLLWNLYFSFFKIGLFTFGGGLAMMPMLKKELVEDKNWISEDEILDYFAISRCTPGIVAVNMATFCGFKKAGILGGCIATFGVVTPSLIIIMILAGLISSVNQFPWVQKALKGINVAVAALLTNVSIDFAKKTVKNVFTFIVCVLAFALTYFFKVNTAFIILGSILLGIIIYFINEHKAKRNVDDDDVHGGKNVRS